MDRLSTVMDLQLHIQIRLGVEAPDPTQSMSVRSRSSLANNTVQENTQTNYNSEKQTTQNTAHHN